MSRGVLIAAVAALASGCAQGPPPTAEVTGKVSLGGKPLANVTIVFIPDKVQGPRVLQSTAQTDAQGIYRLTCDDGRPGAVVGPHTVAVRGDSRAAERDRDDPFTPTPAGQPLRPAQVQKQLPERYRSVATSPLKFEVKPGANTIDLPLTP